jgi:pimeloyl-ACP methyl ester carboxylesterase
VIPADQILSVAGRAVHLHLSGTGQAGPTVVLEAGLASCSPSWAWVLPEVDRFAPVVAYDRAGLGKSAPSQTPRNADRIAGELNEILTATGLPAPYVLVAHSMGGLYVRRFAYCFPHLVGGLVLVDPSHPDQSRRLPGARAEDRLLRWLMNTALGLARTGLLRPGLVPRAFCAGLAPDAEREFRAACTSPSHLDTTRNEFAAWNESCRQARESGDLGDLPLLVLSSSRPADESLRVWHTLHREIAALSIRGRHEVVEGADHLSLLHRREHGLRVVEAIRKVVAAVRGPAEVPARSLP